MSDNIPERLDTEGNKIVFECGSQIYLCEYDEEEVFEKKLDIDDSMELAGINDNKIYVISYGEEINVLEVSATL